MVMVQVLMMKLGIKVFKRLYASGRGKDCVPPTFPILHLGGIPLGLMLFAMLQVILFCQFERWVNL